VALKKWGNTTEWSDEPGEDSE